MTPDRTLSCPRWLRVRVMRWWMTYEPICDGDRTVEGGAVVVAVVEDSRGVLSVCHRQQRGPRFFVLLSSLHTTLSERKKQVSQRKDGRGENTNKDEYRRWQDQYCTLTSGWRTSAHFFSRSVLNPYPERLTVAKGTAFRNHRTKQWNMSWMTIETHEYTAIPQRHTILDPAFG